MLKKRTPVSQVVFLQLTIQITLDEAIPMLRFRRLAGQICDYTIDRVQTVGMSAFPGIWYNQP